MCGIAGILSLKPLNIQALARMSATLRHRGPDDEGYYVSGSAPHFLRGQDTIAAYASLAHIESPPAGNYTIGLLHRRLSIIDTSSTGHQPMSTADGKLVLTYNGEIYNYKELRAELSTLGVVFKSTGDSEVILHAYSKWGRDCVKRFVGMWAFAIYDADKNQVFLSRDRFGIKPLYYTAWKNGFAFASEIKALLCTGDVPADASLQHCLEFVCYGAQADPVKTLYRNIHQLPPGYNLLVNTHSLELVANQYYDLEASVRSSQPAPDGDQFEALLYDSLRLHLRSDVPIGSALSGGLDSSTLVAMAADELAGQTFSTFTAAYRQEGIDESRYAEMVAGSRRNIRAHYCYPSAAGYWESLPKMVWHQDLPLSSTSMFAQWEVMKLASQNGMKVLLDGQGADEILGGYYNFAGIHLIHLLAGFRFLTFNRERKALKDNFTPAINKAMARAFFYHLPNSLQRLARSRERLSFEFLSAAAKAEAGKIKVPGRGGKSFAEQSLLSIRYGMQDLLRFEDRNSMAFSIESRVPFLDHRLVEFCISLSEEEKIRDGWTKLVLRKTAARLLPKEVAWRKDKMGFLTPQRQWKQESSAQLKEFINDSPCPDFISRSYLAELCEKDLQQAAHLSEFWKMISFIQWAQTFNVRFS